MISKSVYHYSMTYLVPYYSKYVEKYHEWMTNSQILALTASDPVLLSDEYAMQESWASDPDKFTFIIFHYKTMIGDVNIFGDHDCGIGVSEDGTCNQCIADDDGIWQNAGI
eukprot:NODE_1409_length_1126_cov_0.479065.p1 type:complete len:111 gc:universal NODE_1409_length_1126_cov_0.479065:411-743(+)